MKRFLLVLVVAAAAAFAIWFGMRGKSLTLASKAAVTSLLPRDTVALLHVPDFNRTRDQWHDSDAYKLWREPAVQAFMERPLGKLSGAGAAREQMQDLGTLGVRDAFIALTGVENGQPKIAAGFQFNGNATDAEKVIGKWRARLEQGTTPVTRTQVDYQRHHIEVATQETVSVASAYDGEWFLAANDVEVLKALLDRVDGRSKDAATTLHNDETYIAASKHLPAGYAVSAYARIDHCVDLLLARMPDAVNTPQFATLRQIKTFAAASTFENGKVRDVLFVGRPKGDEISPLTRGSLNLATANAFLYAATFAQFPKQLAVPPAPGSGAAPTLSPAVQGLAAKFAANGITAEEWAAAFGTEGSMVGDWPETNRAPTLLASIPVKDPARANNLIAAITRVADEDRPWTATSKDGVQYYTLPPANPMLPIAPTIGISQKLLIAGLDPSAVEAAIQRSGSANSELAGSTIFKTAEGRVPEPTTLFAYVDTAMFYTRLDAALRPMLIMGAAFVPGIAETVDLDKLPPAEVITRHLSPLVISQNYREDGYVTESVGPVSFYQAAIALGGASGALAAMYQHKLQP